jgi:LysR family transcriptional regulator, glycine cleavage system transcriptional activator
MTRTSRPPSLLALRAFEAAARHLSFTDAAAELHVSQAAVSRHMRLLESDLGRALFRRLHRRVELTTAGRRFAAEVGAGFARIHRAVEAVRRTEVRSLRLSVEPAFAARWLLPRLGRFATEHPDIELELETSNALRSVGRDTDIAIRYVAAGSRRPRRSGRLLFPTEYMPVVRGARMGALERSRDGAVLGYTLLHDDDGTAWRGWFEAAGLAGFEAARHQYFTDYSIALDAAQQGQGVVLGTPAFIDAELRGGQLMQLGQTRVPCGDYWLLTARNRASSAARRAFCRWLGEETG